MWAWQGKMRTIIHTYSIFLNVDTCYRTVEVSVLEHFQSNPINEINLKMHLVLASKKAR